MGETNKLNWCLRWISEASTVYNFLAQITVTPYGSIAWIRSTRREDVADEIYLLRLQCGFLLKNFKSLRSRKSIESIPKMASILKEFTSSKPSFWVSMLVFEDVLFEKNTTQPLSLCDLQLTQKKRHIPEV